MSHSPLSVLVPPLCVSVVAMHASHVVLLLRPSSSVPSIVLYTMGEPRVGDASFIDTYVI